MNFEHYTYSYLEMNILLYRKRNNDADGYE